MDYNEFAESIKAKYPEYADMDNRELAEKMVAKYPEYNDVTFDTTTSNEPKRPSNPIKNFGQGLMRGLSNPGIAIGNSLRPMIGKEKLTPQQIDSMFPQGYGVSGGVGRFVGEVAPTLLLPEIKAAQLPQWGNRALTGAYQGGLIGGVDSLANNGNLSGIGVGATIGSIANPVIPAVAQGAVNTAKWLAPRLGASIGGVTTDTIEQSIKPNSNALELSADKAKALLLDTTSYIRKAYNNLVNKSGNKVKDEVHKLRDNAYRVPTEDVLNDITSTFDQYQGDYINPARNMTGKLEDNLQDVILQGSEVTPVGSGATDITLDTISPMDLEKAKQQIGSMINWQDETARNFKNPVLEQIYGKFNNRLNELSPDLAQANEVYANLKGFKNNEGLRSILRSGDSIDSASQTLKNYKSTVTKGNTGRNIQDLENTLVNNGYEPFLNTFDDINAAMDLENSIKTGRNFGGVTDLAKQVLLRPTLKGIRGFNRLKENSKAIQNIGNAFNKLRNSGINAPKLYGMVQSFDDLMPIQLDENGQNVYY